jgi:hypothetical protein
MRGEGQGEWQPLLTCYITYHVTLTKARSASACAACRGLRQTANMPLIKIRDPHFDGHRVDVGADLCRHDAFKCVPPSHYPRFASAAISSARTNITA